MATNSNIPKSAKVQELRLIKGLDIPKEDQDLLSKYVGFAYDGPKWTANNEVFYPEYLIEKFYTEFKPFVETTLS